MVHQPDRLEKALRTSPPPAIAALTADVRDRLATQLLAARAHQEQVATEAVDAALKGVPFPVRGMVRRAIGA